MEENNENLNTLFDTINYRNPNELNKFIDEMNIDQALFCLVRATRYAHNKGLFDIEESEVISNCPNTAAAGRMATNMIKIFFFIALSFHRERIFFPKTVRTFIALSLSLRKPH